MAGRERFSSRSLLLPFFPNFPSPGKSRVASHLKATDVTPFCFGCLSSELVGQFLVYKMTESFLNAIASFLTPGCQAIALTQPEVHMLTSEYFEQISSGLNCRTRCFAYQFSSPSLSKPGFLGHFSTRGSRQIVAS